MSCRARSRSAAPEVCDQRLRGETADSGPGDECATLEDGGLAPDRSGDRFIGAEDGVEIASAQQRRRQEGEHAPFFEQPYAVIACHVESQACRHALRSATRPG